MSNHRTENADGGSGREGGRSHASRLLTRATHTPCGGRLSPLTVASPGHSGDVASPEQRSRIGDTRTPLNLHLRERIVSSVLNEAQIFILISVLLPYLAQKKTYLGFTRNTAPPAPYGNLIFCGTADSVGPPAWVSGGDGSRSARPPAARSRAGRSGSPVHRAHL